jgi:hypothetical protein
METKICGICKEDLDIEQFSFKNKLTKKRQAECKECYKKYQKQWYKKNATEHKKNTGRNRNIYVKRNQEFIVKYLSEHPCIDCGETRIPVLEFDHVSGEKEENISYMRQHSMEHLIDEIAKCEIRCSNCHRMKTFRQFNYYKNLLDRDGKLLVGPANIKVI